MCKQVSRVRDRRRHGINVGILQCDNASIAPHLLPDYVQHISHNDSSRSVIIIVHVFVCIVSYILGLDTDEFPDKALPFLRVLCALERIGDDSRKIIDLGKRVLPASGHRPKILAPGVPVAAVASADGRGGM